MAELNVDSVVKKLEDEYGYYFDKDSDHHAKYQYSWLCDMINDVLSITKKVDTTTEISTEEIWNKADEMLPSEFITWYNLNILK